MVSFQIYTFAAALGIKTHAQVPSEGRLRVHAKLRQALDISGVGFACWVGVGMPDSAPPGGAGSERCP